MEDERMDGLSMDIEGAELDNLRRIFPRCFTDGQLDITKLLEACGQFETIDENDREKYEFRWKGKQEALQLAGKRSAGTLRPCPDESKDWDTTGNLYIEGDNLEVLKLMQTAYYRKVKMIYIEIITSSMIQFNDYLFLRSRGVHLSLRWVQYLLGWAHFQNRRVQAA